MDTLEKLQAWYASRCDGTWEHQYGVKIDTLDNPGWAVEIDLAGTPLESHRFVEYESERSEIDWARCKVEGVVFRGYGGAKNLAEIIEVFTSWAATDRIEHLGD